MHAPPARPRRETLKVSTTGTDTDWVVKLVNVQPGVYLNPDPSPAAPKLGDYQQLVRGDVFHGRFRNSHERSEAFVPSQVVKVEFAVPDICHSFRHGQRAMLQVQSTWFPLVDRNPQTFVDIAAAKASDYRRATHRVYRGAGAASAISLLLIPSGSVDPR